MEVIFAKDPVSFLFNDGFGDGRALFRIKASDYTETTNSYYDFLQADNEPIESDVSHPNNVM